MSLQPSSAPIVDSDSRLRDSIVEALVNSGYLPLRSIRVSVNSGCARLTVHVPNYHLKQIAQSSVLTFDGVISLDNHLSVACISGRKEPLHNSTVYHKETQPSAER